MYHVKPWNNVGFQSEDLGFCSNEGLREKYIKILVECRNIFLQTVTSMLKLSFLGQNALYKLLL